MTIIPSLNLPSFLAAQSLFPKMYLRCRKTGIEKVLLGSIKQFSKLEEIPEDHHTYYGAVAFHPQRLWNDFPASFFFLPQVEIEQSKLKTTIQFHGSKISLEKEKPLNTLLPLIFQNHTPSYAIWGKNIQKAIEEIKKGAMQKVVLARQSTFQNSNDPFAWLQYLVESQKNTTIFALQITPNALFLGSSPELLFEREGNFLMAESIAGTRKRGSSPQEDLFLREELEKSQKDRKEFEFVKEFLLSSFSSLCDHYYIKNSDSLIQTNTLWHLYNKVDGTLKSSIRDLDILKALHPTPAVGGLPISKATHFIETVEPFSRGLYAGAIGSISTKKSFFSVAIRSSLITKDRLHAFAGTGIVEDSDPRLEWLELNSKISHWASHGYS